MKRHLLAMAAVSALAASTAANAQSSVTLFGIVDATVAHGSGSIASKTQLTNSGYNGARIGFQGTEELGAGGKAGFWLEAGVTVDNGTGGGTNTNNQASGSVAAANGTQGLTFNRRSTVSIGGNWGELRLGRDYTPHFWSQTIYDPFGTNGAGTNQAFLSQVNGRTTAGAGLYPVGSTGPVVRASNSITYLYGYKFNDLAIGSQGFHLAAQYYLGENATNTAAPVGKKDGTGQSIRVGYGAGPFTAAVAVGRTSYATGDVQQSNIAGDYNFGPAKLIGEYNWDKIGSPASVTGRGGLIGGLVPLGSGVVRASYSKYSYDGTGTGSPSARKWALGYVHNISKRTVLYTTYARVRNNATSNQALNGAVTAAGASSSGYDIGLRHAF